jgi:hypothetical protein
MQAYDNVLEVQLKDGLKLKTDAIIHRFYHDKVIIQIPHLSIKHIIPSNRTEVLFISCVEVEIS